jgi:CRISPR-associated protein Csd1
MVTPWRILKEASANRDTKNISPLLAGNLARCIFTGQVYGESIYTHMLSRIRADGQVNDIRAGMIKACMKRKSRKQGNSEKEAIFTVSLNTESTNTGYRLGRLFAVMEKAQQDANPGLNATIKDRYFGAASTTPGSVFPILIKLSQHHISKAEYGRFRDVEIQGILETVEAFPAYMNLDDQGQFVLGYYHQKQALYTKKTQNGVQEKER